jgi:hypothetical protein
LDVVTDSSLRPINFVKMLIRPPKMRVVISTTTKVELTRSPEFGDKDGFICKLSAKAIAPKSLIRVIVTSDASAEPDK